jgi:hypothetical protein
MSVQFAEGSSKPSVAELASFASRAKEIDIGGDDIVELGDDLGMSLLTNQNKVAPSPKRQVNFGSGSSGGSDGSDPETLHNHLKSLFEGKIGKLAKEIADDIGDDLAESFKDDFGGATSTQDVFAKLMKNPQKISGLVKTVGEKLNKKMAEGDISRDDIMREASEMMKNMGNLGGGGGAGGGMGNFAEMFKQMAKGMGGMPKGMEGLIPKGAKINTQALAKMEKKTTAAKMREEDLL